MTLLVPVLLTLALVGLLYLAASFSALETALFVLRKKGMPGDRALGIKFRSKGAPEVSDPSAFLPEVLLLGSFANFLVATLGLWFVLGPLMGLGTNPWLSGLALFSAVFLIVEFVPNALALRSPSRALGRTLPLFLVVRGLTRPVTAILHHISEALVVFFSPKKIKPRHNLLPEEVETLIDMREEQGALGGDEADLLRSVVDLHSLTVRDAMTPRVDLPLMPYDAGDEEALRTLESTRHRFVAVYDEKQDAVAYVVDVTQWKLAGRPHWSTVTETPVFVPNIILLVEAWQQHLPGPASVAVVLDEYGGFEGLLTWASLVEVIFAKAAPAPGTAVGIQSLGGDRYLVSGGTRLEEIERELEVVIDAEDVDTIGGLVMHQLGYPPKPGETLVHGRLHIKVKRTAKARIQQLELVVTNPEEEEDEG